MKKFKLSLRIVMSFFVASLILSSCDTQENLSPVEDPTAVSDDIKLKFAELGFDADDATTTYGREFLDPSEKGYILEDDILITEENFQQMLESKIEHVGPVGEQYRTSNRVSGNRTISIIGYTGGSFALDNTMRSALQLAVDNYNALNINLNFTLTFGTNYPAYDIVVYKVNSSGGGGSAGFPSGGDPYQFVQILSGTSSFGTDVTEHVITHEIGHCLGLRHTDYFNRSLSCGTGGNEGNGGVGAIYIPGTPSGFDGNSIMLSCFNSGVDGEFGSGDVTALEWLF